MPSMPRVWIVCCALFASFLVSPPIQAQEPASCKDLANQIVKSNVEGILKQVLKDKPELKGMDQGQLVKKAGRLFLTAERPDFKAYGYMMLLWFGDKADRDLVANTAAKLTTKADRAHFYFVLGMFQIRSKDPSVAAKGRDYIKQMRASGLVTFVTDDMWDQLISKCRIAEVT